MSPITTPADAALDELTGELARRGEELDRTGKWPREQLDLCGQYGVFRWFLSPAWGGYHWALADVLRGYMRLGGACLTTTFILTQRTGACRRIAASLNDDLAGQLLPGLANGSLMASVGISHLTTSRRHLDRPVLAARQTPGGFVLDGYSPWVTGGPHCDWIVTGGTLEDGRQILIAVPRDAPGVVCRAPAELTALAASHTGAVEFHHVEAPERWLLAGPVERVMSQGVGANTGGLETSALAVGLSGAALTFIEQEEKQRSELHEAAAALRLEHDDVQATLLGLASGDTRCTNEQVRTQANSLALRTTQAALAAAKGTGYLRGHPAGRWCREALFFLVWSCPPTVMNANLCELAGLDLP